MASPLAVDKLEEAKLLTVPLAEVPGYNADANAALTATMGDLKKLELPHIGRLERDQDEPIDVIMDGLTLARHLGEDADQ